MIAILQVIATLCISGNSVNSQKACQDYYMSCMDTKMKSPIWDLGSVTPAAIALSQCIRERK